MPRGTELSDLDGSQPPAQSEDTDSKPIITTIGGVPVGISVANILGVDNAFAAFAIDVVTDPILWLSLALPPLAASLAGAKIAKGAITLGAAGAAAAKGLNVAARTGKGLSGLTRLGRAARSAKGLSVEAKLQNIDRSLELLEKAAANPQLARQAKTALEGRNMEAFRAAVAGIQATKPGAKAVSGLLPILRSSGFRNDLKSLFQLEKTFVKKGVKGGLSRIDALDAASKQHILQLGGGTAERTLLNQQAAMIFRNPFTGYEKTLIKAPGFVGAMEGLGGIGAAAFPAALAAKIGVDAQRASVAVNNFHDVAKTAAAAGDNVTRQLFPEVAERGIGTVAPGAARTNPFAEVSRSVVAAGKATKAWTFGADWGDAYHNYLSAAMHEGRVASGALEKAFAIGGGMSKGAVSSMKRFLGLSDIGVEALIKQQGEVVPTLLEAGGRAGLAGTPTVKATKAASQLTKEQLQVVDILKNNYENMHAAAFESGNRIGFVENYTHSVVRLTDKGKETFKDKGGISGVVDQVSESLFGRGTGGTNPFGKQGIQKRKKFLHTELLDMERKGLIEVLSKDPFETYRHYVNSAARMHGQTQVKGALLSKQMVDEASGLPLMVDMGKEAGASIRRTIFAVAREVNDEALNKLAKEGVDTVDMFDAVESALQRMPKQTAAAVQKRLDSVRPSLLGKLERDTGQKYITAMGAYMRWRHTVEDA